MCYAFIWSRFWDLQTFLSKGHTAVRGTHILRNVIVSGYVTFYQINKFFLKVFFFIIDKMASRDGFVPLAVVWSPLF